MTTMLEEWAGLHRAVEELGKTLSYVARWNWLTLRVGAWRCARGWHDWGYHPLKDYDLCQRPTCLAEWRREKSYKYVSADEVYSPLTDAEGPLAKPWPLELYHSR